MKWIKVISENWQRSNRESWAHHQLARFLASLLLLHFFWLQLDKHKSNICLFYNCVFKHIHISTDIDMNVYCKLRASAHHSLSSPTKCLTNNEGRSSSWSKQKAAPTAAGSIKHPSKQQRAAADAAAKRQP